MPWHYSRLVGKPSLTRIREELPVIREVRIFPNDRPYGVAGPFLASGLCCVSTNLRSSPIYVESSAS